MTENKELQDHADKLGEIITQQTNKRLQLENRIEELEKESKKLIKEISVKQNENYELKQRIGHFEEVIREVVRSEYTNFESGNKLKKLIEEKIGRSVAKIEKVSNHTYKCKGCEEIVDDLDFNCKLELCYYCLDMMKEEEKENESGG